MEKILTGELNTVSLLAAIILGLLTKRIVPWWIYEEAVNKLKLYEEAAPELIREMRRLSQTVRESEEARRVEEKPITRTVLVNKKRKAQ